MHNIVQEGPSTPTQLIQLTDQTNTLTNYSLKFQQNYQITVNSNMH